MHQLHSQTVAHRAGAQLQFRAGLNSGPWKVIQVGVTHLLLTSRHFPGGRAEAKGSDLNSRYH